MLLRLLLEAFVPKGDPLVLGVDETLERRRGKKVGAKGIYRDPVRSTHHHFVKASALRWICVTLLAPVPWASRVWALPFLSALAYSERFAREHGKRHKTLTEWAWQLLLLVRRWYPQREIVAGPLLAQLPTKLCPLLEGEEHPVKPMRVRDLTRIASPRRLGRQGNVPRCLTPQGARALRHPHRSSRSARQARR
jgi:hypothetical protein